MGMENHPNIPSENLFCKVTNQCSKRKVSSFIYKPLMEGLKKPIWDNHLKVCNKFVTFLRPAVF